jgi:hypothetical protein
VSSEATGAGEDPERRSNPDLIGEARSSKSTRWRRKKAEGRIRCSSVGGGSHRSWPGSAGDGGGDIDRMRGSGEEEKGVSEEIVGWVGLTDPDPSHSGEIRWWAGPG